MKKIYINPRDADFSGFISLKSLCDFILQVAGDDADERGFGLWKLRERNFSWVLCYIAIEIKRFPKCGETIDIDTWVEKVNRIFTFRHFDIYDENGDIVISASTNWSMIDFKQRSMVNITKEIDCTNVVRNEPLKISPIKRVPSFEPTRSSEHIVKFSDIDVNQHTNSSKYLEWMCDFIQNPFEILHTVKRVDINYHHEAIYNDRVIIENRTDGNEQLFAAKNSEGTVLCNAIFSFE